MISSLEDSELAFVCNPPQRESQSFDTRILQSYLQLRATQVPLTLADSTQQITRYFRGGTAAADDWVHTLLAHRVVRSLPSDRDDDTPRARDPELCKKRKNNGQIPDKLPGHAPELLENKMSHRSLRMSMNHSEMSYRRPG